MQRGHGFLIFYVGTMTFWKRIFLAMLAVTTSAASAQQISQEQFAELMGRVSVLNYWSKAPTALMLKCGASYPDARASSQKAYLDWATQNADFNRQVDQALTSFVPLVASTIGKTVDAYEALATRVVDEEVAQRFFDETPEPRRRGLCVDFGTLLSQMMSTDLAKPRVTLALQGLPQFQKYVKR